ncbi:hypothetical protein SAMN04487914_1233 [Arthrobacter sp. ok909]|nr:hypothetical protein SAMN04487914_1233 [Arthrobacter sp. ok909]
MASSRPASTEHLSSPRPRRVSSGFPHPDKKYPHLMNQWPEGMEEPVSIELGLTGQLAGYSGNTSWYNDPQNEVHKDLPSVTVINRASACPSQSKARGPVRRALWFMPRL